MQAPAKVGEAVVRIVRTITINRSPHELFAYWRHLEKLPQVMKHLKQVHLLDEKTSEWTTTAPVGRTVTWKAAIIRERPDQLLEWRSCPDSAFETSGLVRFEPAPLGRGTELTVEIGYRAPGGALARAVARFYGEEPAQQLREDLRRFKWFMETGEVPFLSEESKPTATDSPS